ncbi:hypothetical protein IWQ62_005974, partial [Dispira parvispora]
MSPVEPSTVEYDAGIERFINPHYLMYVCVLSAHHDDQEIYKTKNGKNCILSGSLVSSVHNLRDINGKRGAFFVFPDLSIRLEGTYRLKFHLYELVGHTVYYCDQVVSNPFTVYSPKRFPGMAKSTLLSRTFANQGLKIRIRTDAGSRKRTRKDKSPDYSEVPSDEETPSVVSDDQPPAHLARFTGYRTLAPKGTPCVRTSPHHTANQNSGVDSPGKLSLPASHTGFTRADSVNSNPTFTGKPSSSYTQAVESPRVTHQPCEETPSEYDVAYPGGTYQLGKGRRWLAPPRRRIRYQGHPGEGRVNLVYSKDSPSYSKERSITAGPPANPTALHTAFTEQQQDSPLPDSHSPYRTYPARISSPDSAIQLYHHEDSPPSPGHGDPTKGAQWTAEAGTAQGSPLPWNTRLNKRRILAAASFGNKPEVDTRESIYPIAPRRWSSFEETPSVGPPGRLPPPHRLNPIQPKTRPNPQPPMLPSLSAVIEQSCRVRASPFKGAVKRRRYWPGIPSRVIPGLQIQLPTHSPRTPSLPTPCSNRT